MGEIGMSSPDKILAVARNYTNSSVYQALNELVFSSSDTFSFKEVVERLKLNGPSLQRVLNFALSNDLITDLGDGGYRKIPRDVSTNSIKLLELLLDENLISDLSENSRLSENSDAISTGVALNIFLKEGDRILLSPGLFPLLQTKSEKSMRLWIKNFINVSSKVFSPNCIISAIRSGEVQWQNAFGINITNPFDLMKDYPEIFTNLMEGMHQANVTDSVFVSPKINLTDCKTVLDIGGASGALGLSLCDLYKNIESFYIYDLHTAIDLYKSMHARYRGNSAAPVKYLPGDFFQQTESGSLFGIEPSQKFDAIILGWIIHDWDDDRSVEILSKAKSHLKKDGKLILLEAVLPDSRLGNATMLDITMLIQTGGKERTLAEYKDLLGKSGLALKEVLQTEGRRQIITAGIA